MAGANEPKHSSAVDQKGSADGTNREKPFMCGVVEGFYGRPWSTEQRRELFHRMKKFGMNTYMYAPKDDAKHRMNWRELYSVEEVERLSLLISEAKANDITFVYALSPGIDMTFSSSKDVTLLKRKLDQMVSLRCTAFALLFDDIDTEMSSAADKEAFQSPAHAQVAITNELYEYLGQPATFLFCPTEYCASRAVPNVSTSPYLSVVGSRLINSIDVMWTGPRVVSRKITAESIDELAAAICRRPVIWDNLHANDYDHRRLFLGPYSGRQADVVSRLAGVLTNPNCQFEANYVALHTLAAWSRCALQSPADNPEPRVTDADIKLEVGDEAAADSLPYPWSYSPKQVLLAAAADWSSEFEKKAIPMVPPPRYVDVTPQLKTTAERSGALSTVEEGSVEQPDGLDPVVEPMEVAIDGVNNGGSSIPAGGAVETPCDIACASAKSSAPCRSAVSVEDVLLLCDMMYTPFEYGAQSTAMLGEFLWLKSNAHAVAGKSAEKNELAAEWHLRADKFHDWVTTVSQVADRLFEIPNRAILYDLYPYMWEARGVLCVVSAFIRWLGMLGHSEELCLPPSSDLNPPNTHKGGLTAELERMLPLSQAHDLFPHKPSSMPSWNIVYTVRPYRPQDEAAVYEVCKKTCDDGADGSHVFADKPNVIGDKLVGDILTLSPHLSFVVEDRCGVICGYALGVRDALDHYRKVDVAWTPAMREKYPSPLGAAGSTSSNDNLTPEEEVVLSLHSPGRPAVLAADVTPTLYQHYPSLVRLAVLQHVAMEDRAAARRALACLLSALKACGSCGVHCEVNAGEEDTLEFYTQLGFVSSQRASPGALTSATSDDVLICVRAL